MSTLPVLDTTELPTPSRLPHRRNLLITILATAVGVLLIAAGLRVAGSSVVDNATGSVDGGDTAVAVADTSTTTVVESAPAAVVSTTTATEQVAGVVDLTDASAIGEAVIPSVVTIQISDTFRNREVPVGSGSGVVWDGNGSVVTNAHVVDAGESYEVVLSDGRVYSAALLGVDETTDLAVLHIEADELIAIDRGSTEGLLAGDPAIAVGSPLGLDGGPSLTVGVVSALGRTVEIDASTVLYGMIQADAPITEGSSGGALVNEAGELIGITSAVGVSTVGVEGIGFSTPIEIVTRVVTEILTTGEASQPVIGITGTTAFATTRDGGQEPIGVQVEEVSSGSAAGAAGIEIGDVISAVDGLQIDTMAQLVFEIRTHSAGATISLTLVADGAETVVDVTLSDG